MSKIEVGEYVRTKEGYLGILIAINKQDYNYLVVDTSIEVRKDGYTSTYLYLKKGNIKKHSKQLIDLIEVGDYVNGSYVEGFIEKNKFQNKLIITEAGMIDNNDIKSIVTKECFQSVSYEV